MTLVEQYRAGMSLRFAETDTVLKAIGLETLRYTERTTVPGLEGVEVLEIRDPLSRNYTSTLGRPIDDAAIEDGLMALERYRHWLKLGERG